MTKEICNQYLFFMKKYRLPVEENFMENFSISADNCADAAELFYYMTRRITSSYEKAARLKKQDENRPIRLVKKYVEEHFGEPADAGRGEPGGGSLTYLPQHDL